MEMHTQSLVARHNNLHSIGIHEYINMKKIIQEALRRATVLYHFTYIINTHRMKTSKQHKQGRIF